MPLRLPVLMLIALLAAGCARVPALGGAGSEVARAAGPWPRIVPLAPIEAAGRALRDQPPLADPAALQTRAAALRARAAGLAPPVIVPAAQRRLNRAISGGGAAGNGP